MRFRICGAERETGEESTFELEALTVQEAREKANAAGYFVSEVKPLVESQAPATPPSESPPTTPPSFVEKMFLSHTALQGMSPPTTPTPSPSPRRFQIYAKERGTGQRKFIEVEAATAGEAKAKAAADGYLVFTASEIRPVADSQNRAGPQSAVITVIVLAVLVLIGVVIWQAVEREQDRQAVKDGAEKIHDEMEKVRYRYP